MAIGKKLCDDLEDSEIIGRSLREIDYFACLYDRYESRLLGYIRKISFATHEEADDILQDSFVKIWRNLNSYDPDMKLASWVYRIVHNETISFCRKKRSFGKNKQVELDKAPYDSLPGDADGEPDPEIRIMLTYQVLDQLPMKYREILVLKFLEKMSYEEVSDVLKIPEGTVAARINRAKKLFRNIAEKDQITFNL